MQAPARVGRTSGRWPAPTPSCRCGPSCSPISRRRWRPTSSSSATSRGSCSSPSSTASAGAGSRSSDAIPSRRSSLRDGRVEVDGPAARGGAHRPRDPGGDGDDAGDVPRAGDRRAAAAARRADGIPRLRRRAGGRAPAEPATGRPPSAGRRAVDDRLARRLRSLAPAGDADRERARARPRLGRARRRLRRRRGQHRAGRRPSLARPLPYLPVEPPSPDDVLPEVKSSMPDGLYQQAVEVAKEHIVAGDIFQVVLAQRYDLQLDAEPFDVYRVLRQVNPSPYMYFVRHPELTIVGSSPEPMVQVLASAEGSRVISRPIAGTRKRGSTDEHDRRLAAELTEHPKERAEHVMLVDLARNDVGRVARFGSVHVDELMTLERYSHVMHLTSQVSGDLVERPGTDRRPPGDPAGGHGERGAEGAGDGDHRRPRAAAARARTPASSATWTGAATSTRRSPSARCSAGRTAPACRPGRGSSPIRCPTTRTSSAATRPPPCWRPCRRRGG